MTIKELQKRFKDLHLIKSTKPVEPPPGLNDSELKVLPEYALFRVVVYNLDDNFNPVLEKPDFMLKEQAERTWWNFHLVSHHSDPGWSAHVAITRVA